MAPPWPTAGEDLTLERAAAYLAVGADGSLVPGAVDPGTVELLVDAVDGLLNVMAGSATLPSPSRPHPSWSAARELLDAGTHNAPADGLDHGELNALFGGPPQ
ncbi:isocitrate lyase/phosphoenolpyruvate mutase family protein [Streptomyces canus]|uniref:isocitrate lyase/phosphoenolpyruvate mutase family protein n=1 Tax=Streptomyces canus TaxID=58343 RepID=UPI0032454F4E